MRAHSNLRPNYRSKLERVLRLVNKDEVVEASDLLDELMKDTEQFRVFVESTAFQPFCASIDAHCRYLRYDIKHTNAKLNVLAWIRKDLRSKPWKKAPVATRRRLTAHK